MATTPRRAAAPSPLALLALALLVERPMHPYEMYQLLIERHEDRLLKVRPGTLYHSVKWLASVGWVEAVGTSRSGNRPERTTFAVTTDGRRALVDWVAQMLRRPATEYSEFAMALAEAHNLAVAEVVGGLRERVGAVQHDLEALVGYIDAARHDRVPARYFVEAEFTAARQAAEVDWLTTLIHRIETGEIDWPTGGAPEWEHVEPDGATDRVRAHATTSRTAARETHRKPGRATGKPSRSTERTPR